MLTHEIPLHFRITLDRVIGYRLGCAVSESHGSFLVDGDQAKKIESRRLVLPRCRSLIMPSPRVVVEFVVVVLPDINLAIPAIQPKANMNCLNESSLMAQYQATMHRGSTTQNHKNETVIKMHCSSIRAINTNKLRHYTGLVVGVELELARKR